MADDVDLTEQRTEFEAKVHLYQSHRDEPSIKEPTGACLNCEEPLTDRRWCNADCRDQWERRDS